MEIGENADDMALDRHRHRLLDRNRRLRGGHQRTLSRVVVRQRDGARNRLAVLGRGAPHRAVEGPAPLTVVMRLLAMGGGLTVAPHAIVYLGGGIVEIMKKPLSSIICYDVVL